MTALPIANTDFPGLQELLGQRVHVTGEQTDEAIIVSKIDLSEPEHGRSASVGTIGQLSDDRCRMSHDARAAQAGLTDQECARLCVERGSAYVFVTEDGRCYRHVHAGRGVTTLSKGFKRRVGLAQAMIHDPEVLILDEPTDGLDPNQRVLVQDLLANLSQERCVILSTHILDEAEKVCNRAVIISDGRILVDSTPRALVEHSSSGRLDEVFRTMTRGTAA